MAKNKTINVKGTEIVVISSQENDFISLTDIARYKNALHTDDIIKNWLRNRNTIELLGFWEAINNPSFKPVEFDGFRKQSRPTLKLKEIFVIQQVLNNWWCFPT